MLAYVLLVCSLTCLLTCGLACLGGSVHDPRDLLTRGTVADAARLRPKQRTARRLHIEPGTLTMAIVSIATFYGFTHYGCLDCSYTRLLPNQSGEAKRTDGLVAGHAYSLIRVVEVRWLASGGCGLCQIGLQPLLHMVPAPALLPAPTLLIKQMYALTHERTPTHLPR